MALITAAAREEIIALFVGMFNAAPGADNLNKLVAAVEGGTTGPQLAAGLATKPEFALVYPALLTAQEFADRLVENLLGDEVSAAAKTWSTNWVLTNLNAGMSRAQVILTAVTAIRATTNTNYTNAKAALQNKVDVAEYYSVDKLLSSTDFDDLQAVIDGVTSDVATATAAKTAIDNDPNNNTGENFTLTDDIVDTKGTGGDDTFKGVINDEDSTIQTGDFINGGNGNDRLDITIIDGNNDPLLELASV
jgi:hypothetical protein